MKRVTITLPDDLERDLSRYLSRHDTPPSITVVMQAAMREFLATRELRERGYRPPRKPFDLAPLEERDDLGEADVSVAHDEYVEH